MMHTQESWVQVGIVSSQAFGISGCQQIVIGGYEDERRETSGCEGLVGDQGRSKLHSSVIALTQALPVSGL